MKELFLDRVFGSFLYAALSGKVGQDKYYIPKFNRLYSVNFFVQYSLLRIRKKSSFLILRFWSHIS